MMVPVQNNESNASIKPEISFIFTCLRQQQWTEKEKTNLYSLLENEIDWEYVIESARYHKIISLLHKTLVNNFKKNIPEDVLTKIVALQKSIVFHGLAQSVSLANTISLLNTNGIDVLPIKGPVLAERLYGSCSMRSYGDIDILIRKRDIQKTLDILLKNNYVLLPIGIPRRLYDRFMQHAYHGRLLDPSGVTIELHWELTGFFVSKGITFDSLEPYLRRTEFCGRPSLDLTDEMLFIYLCIHGIKHQYVKLDYICSLAGLLKIAPCINWPLVFDLGKRFMITRGLLLSLALLDNLFGLPASYKRDDFAASAQHFTDFADKLLKWNMSTALARDITNPLQKNSSYRAVVFDGRLEVAKLIYHTKIVPHQEEWERIRLPNTLFYLYFLCKPYRAFSLAISNRSSIFYRKMINSLQKKFKGKAEIIT